MALQILRPGTFKPLQGKPATFTAEDLNQIAADYNPAKRRAPLVKGHPAVEKEAQGYASRLFVDGGVLCADTEKVDPEFAAQVNCHKWPGISVALYQPGHPQNPLTAEGKSGWYLKHVGFLGSWQPAVDGLEAPALGEPEEGVTEVLALGAWSDRTIASLFRNIRDFFIEQFGKERTDEVIPSWAVDSVQEEAIQEQKEEGLMAYAEAEERDKQLAEKERALAERERSLSEKEKRIEFAAFAEQLIADGLLLPVRKDFAIETLVRVSRIEAPLAFGEGDDRQEMSQLDFVRELLSNQKPHVEFGEIAGGDDQPAVPAVAFAAPDGFEAEPSKLALLALAEQYQRANPGTDLITAYKAVGGK